MKTVLVTGCSASSIGSAIALEFAKQPDWHVYATARDTSRLSHFDAVSNVTKIELDVMSNSSMAQALRTVSQSASGTLDVLVNNAGIMGVMGPALEADMDVFRAVYETNVFAPLALSQLFAPMLVANKGQIINVGSTSSLSSFVWQGSYSSSKAALASLSKTMRYELSPLGVTVTHLVVGAVQSSIVRNKRPLALKSSSFYSGIEAHINAHRSHEEISKYMVPVGPVAEGIVQNALRPKPKTEFWIGGLIWLTWILVVLRSISLFESLGNEAHGLKKLRLQRAKTKVDGGKEE